MKKLFTTAFMLVLMLGLDQEGDAQSLKSALVEQLESTVTSPCTPILALLEIISAPQIDGLRTSTDRATLAVVEFVPGAPSSSVTVNITTNEPELV